MLDLYALDGEPVFRDYQAIRVQNLLVEPQRYPYWPTVGLGSMEWWNSPLIYDMDTFKNTVRQYLLDYQVPLEHITVDKQGGSVGYISIDIILHKESVKEGEYAI